MAASRLGETLIEQGLVSDADVTRALSEQLHIPVVDLRTAEPTEDAIAFVPSADAHRYDILPLLVVDGSLACRDR